MFATYDDWKCTPPSYEEMEDPCPCCAPGFTGPCPVCDACHCCGAIGDEPCEGEVRTMERADTIPAPPFEWIAAE